MKMFNKYFKAKNKELLKQEKKLFLKNEISFLDKLKSNEENYYETYPLRWNTQIFDPTSSGISAQIEYQRQYEAQQALAQRITDERIAQHQYYMGFWGASMIQPLGGNNDTED